MTDTTTVVFGGSGFLGRSIVRAMAARGEAVRVAARRPDAADVPRGVELRWADIQEDAAVAAAVADADTVVNAVSLYVEDGGPDFDDIHVEGATRLARLTHPGAGRQPARPHRSRHRRTPPVMVHRSHPGHRPGRSPMCSRTIKRVSA